MKKGRISIMFSFGMFFILNIAFSQDNLLRTYFSNYKADRAILVKDSSNFYFTEVNTQPKSLFSRGAFCIY